MAWNSTFVTTLLKTAWLPAMPILE